MEAGARFVAIPKPGFAPQAGSVNPDIVGWVAVSILFATLSAQAWKEWRDRVKTGITPLFFVGQVAASIAFIIYSAMLGNVVFIVGNSLVLAVAVAGGAILLWNRRRR